MTFHARTFAFATSLLLLAACGQTGPLHLPEDAPAKEGYLLKKRAEKQETKPTPAATNSVPPESAAPETRPN